MSGHPSLKEASLPLGEPEISDVTADPPSKTPKTKLFSNKVSPMTPPAKTFQFGDDPNTLNLLNNEKSSSPDSRFVISEMNLVGKPVSVFHVFNFLSSGHFPSEVALRVSNRN